MGGFLSHIFAQVMKEIGIDISHSNLHSSHRSKSLDEIPASTPIDTLVTVCDKAGFPISSFTSYHAHANHACHR
jgi:hypothetical protein